MTKGEERNEKIKEVVLEGVGEDENEEEERGRRRGRGAAQRKI
jgi:hypothetical protein